MDDDDDDLLLLLHTLTIRLVLDHRAPTTTSLGRRDTANRHAVTSGHRVIVSMRTLGLNLHILIDLLSLSLSLPKVFSVSS